jgi:hypothetical protein
MLVLEDGKATTKEYMGFIMSGGKVPDILMDVPLEKFTCNHESMIPYYSERFWFGQCSKCAYKILFDPDILEEFDLFDKNILAPLIIKEKKRTI